MKEKLKARREEIKRIREEEERKDPALAARRKANAEELKRIQEDMRNQLKGLTGEARAAKFKELREKQREALIRMARDTSSFPKTSSPGLKSLVKLKPMKTDMELNYENDEPPPYDHSINNFEEPPPAYDSEPKNDEENGEETTPPPFANPKLAQRKMDEYNGTMTTPPPYFGITQPKIDAAPSYSSKKSKVPRSGDPQRKSGEKCLIS